MVTNLNRITVYFNFTVCNSSLGLENGRVKDSQLSATSYKSYMYISRLSQSYNMKAKHGRLNNKLAWCGLGPYRDVRPVSYFQVDFGEEVQMTGLATQGLKNSFFSYFVKTYKVKFSFNGSHWFNYSTPNKVSVYFSLESSSVLLTNSAS